MPNKCWQLIVGDTIGNDVYCQTSADISLFETVLVMMCIAKMVDCWEIFHIFKVSPNYTAAVL